MATTVKTQFSVPTFKIATGVLIDGVWEGAEKSFDVVDKYTGDHLAEVQEPQAAQLSRMVDAVAKGFEKGAPPPVERAAILNRAAKLVQDKRQQFIDIIVAETGFTLSDAAGEIDRTVVTLTLCAEEATRIVGDTVSFAATPGQHERLGFTIRVPRGIVCAITPFNSPLNTVVHKVGPALAAGNAVILKPSGFTPLTSALLCEVLLEAGLPSALLGLAQGMDGDVGSWLLDEQRIAFYSFTGSTRVGRIIQQRAGLRGVQLELGSIASTIVCADADLARAVPKIANATFRKAGQVCTSIQRLYVASAVLPELQERLLAEAKGMPVGDPRDPKTRVGPMISLVAAERAQSWIDEAVGDGASLVAGGNRKGPVLSPTIVSQVKDGMKVLDQEIFAPCLSLVPFETLGDAVTHANNSPFGLAAGIFTRDVNAAFQAARSLSFGSVHINETSSSRGDAMPFGGVKDSGFGHEGPAHAIKEVTEERLITLNF